MPAYSQLTQAQALQILSERLEDTSNVYWSLPELRLYLAESLHTWQALTSWYRQTISLPLLSAGIPWYDLASGGAPNILINNQGLVVNAYNSVAGRGDYFNQASGTSEGQFLLGLGLLEAYKVTNNPGALRFAQLVLSNILSVLYRGGSIPATVDATHIFAPHWLFCVKAPFQTAQIWYTDTFLFSNGVAVVPDTRGPVRYIFQAISTDAVLLWQNPYATLVSGVAYPVASYAYNSALGGTVVNLSSAFSGTLTVIYSTLSGTTISPGTPYEAWPDWRTLAPGEIDAATDSFNWAYRMYQDAASVLGASWPQAAQATLQQAVIAYNVNDTRDWVKPTYTLNPFSEGSRFSFNSRTQPAVFSCDSQGNTIATIVAGVGETQYGNAAINDSYNAVDSTSISIGSNVPISVTLFIDPTQTYSAANRYSASVALTGSGLQTIILTAANFKNPAGTPIAPGTPVYTFGVSDTAVIAHVLTIGRVRQLPPLTLAYSPGALPFTANFLGQPATLIDWRGPAYIGYQSPWMWKQTGNETAVRNSIQMMADAQTQWHVQTGQSDSGPFAPVYYFPRQDAVQYGVAGTFGWSGPDPNTKWGGYQYRPLAELAECLKACNGTEAYFSQGVGVADLFLAYIDTHWLQATSGPPSDYPIGSAGQVNYPEPHFVALILRAALFMDLVKRPLQTGPINATYQSLLTKAMTFWSYWYQSSGSMAGTFSTDTVNQTWFGFWHGEILRTLSQLIGWANNNGQSTTAQQAASWINGMVSFLSLSAPLAPVATDADLISEMAYQLLEPQLSNYAWAGTPQFSLTGLESAISESVNRFLADTSMVCTRQTVSYNSSSNGVVSLPSNVIDVVRLAWQPTGSTSWTLLWRASEWETRSFLSNPANSPVAYTRSVSSPSTVRLFAPPTVNGTLDLIAVTAAPPLNLPTAPTNLGVPDDYVWAIKWAALAILLRKDGEANDPVRAQYAEDRYREAVELARAFPSVLQALVDTTVTWVHSIYDLDSFASGWENAPATGPTALGLAGRNLLAISPPPTSFNNISLDLVATIPVPLSDSDVVQVPADVVPVLLEYALHLAAFKMGGQEFLSTEPKRRIFYAMAAEYNERLRQLEFFSAAFRQPAFRQYAQQPLISAPNAKALTDGK